MTRMQKGATSIRKNWDSKWNRRLVCVVQLKKGEIIEKLLKFFNRI